MGPLSCSNSPRSNSPLWAEDVSLAPLLRRLCTGDRFEVPDKDVAEVDSRDSPVDVPAV